MKYLRIISGIFLLAIIFFSWGFITVEYKAFPWSLLNPIRDEILAFVRGGEANKKSIGEKLANDAGLRPERLLVDLTKNDKREYASLVIDGLRKRRELPLIYINGEHGFPPGYLLLWGSFDFKNHLHGAILLNWKGEVLHSWMPEEKPFVDEITAYNKMLADKIEKIGYQEAKGRFPHGLAVFPDGSIIFNDGDHGNGMQKIDICSNTLWVKLGKFNHALTRQPNESSVWSIDGENILHKIDVNSGKSLKVLDLLDVMRLNPGVDVINIRRNYLQGEWLDDRWHLNDIEPLPPRYADSYPEFSSGDLLLSMRSLNAVMVVDPSSKKIKWWRVGAYSRQHDPDWQPDGIITVFDNQMRDKHGVAQATETPRFSRIVGIDPENFNTEVLYDGKKDHFYSNIRGKHQLLPNKDILITSSQQGRVLITDPDGETVFEFLNRYDEKKALLVSEAMWLPRDYFNFDIGKTDCTSDEYKNTQWKAGSDTALHYSADRLELHQDIDELRILPLEKELSFRDESFLVFEGWSGAEDRFRWSEGSSASLYFRLPDESNGRELEIKLMAHTLNKQRIHTYFNGHFFGVTEVDIPKEDWLFFDLSTSVVKQSGVNILRFEFPDARSPNSQDPRKLAMAFHSIRFTSR